MSEPLASLVSKSIRTLLTETILQAAQDEAYIINRGEPGLLTTLKSLTAARASASPGPNRKPVVSHANHILYGWTLVSRALHGDQHAFENTNWDLAWKLEKVNDQEWADLLSQLDKTGRDIIETAPRITDWIEIMLTGVYGTAAHNAYHLGAIRQILRDNP